MPRDPKRNIQSYEHQGGNLNEFEFQKSQREMAEEAKPQFSIETGNPSVSQPEHVAEVMAEAHRIVEKRRKHRAPLAPDKQSAAADKGSAKSVKKTPKQSAKKTSKKKTSKSAAPQKAPTKLAKKTSKAAGPKKRASVKARGQRLATSR